MLCGEVIKCSTTLIKKYRTMTNCCDIVNDIEFTPWQMKPKISEYAKYI